MGDNRLSNSCIKKSNIYVKLYLDVKILICFLKISTPRLIWFSLKKKKINNSICMIIQKGTFQ